ncbi:uncharacterized protein DSM5745_07246 [Aspergillus mulundensis]|uniref:Glycoprotease family protein n=1 Tax=Aspergillus mulundensis TaxID=1810919 RepID=A0A3D8RL00_9EURO|nr:hypothetical protein DSM5745_07246 [Aspergillus mulundensis]RDW74584.1 hypothetical protein DSM5745_07246 [Aspergillus mulundensis]
MPLALNSSSGSSSGPERPRAQLTIPTVPKFPLSSPITDEIASPAGTSEESFEEDRDTERNPPYEVLSKVQSRNPFVSNASNVAPADRIREFEQSVTGHVHTVSPERDRERERPVGLNLEIPGSARAPQPQPRKDTTGAFVDLNDLKILSQAREEERAARKVKGILKKDDGKKEKGDTRGFQRLQDDPSDSGFGHHGKRASLLDAMSRVSRKKVRDDGISPTDRPIMIGFSVPYDSPELQDVKEKEIDSAGTQHTPLTPSIIVTPAKEDSFWNHLRPQNANSHARPRAASSVYSQPSPHLGLDDAPPVPALPAFYSTGNDTATAGVSSSVRKRRSMSTGAVDEKSEEQPRGRPRSQSNEKAPRLSDRLTINTSLNARASQGWWNYLLSPLLSASSLLSPKTPTTVKTRPPLPPISTGTSSTGLSDEWWDEKEKWEEKEKEKEKEIERSYFSPDTPEATRRVSSWQNMNGNPFADFDWSIDEQQRFQNHDQSPEGQERVASMMFAGQTIEGSAAEYYQACAYEVFSTTPYFECINHVCSITPKDKIAVVGADDQDQHHDTQGARGLLIDVDDMPRSHNLESPGSGITSINSSPSDDASRLSKELGGGSRVPPSEGALGTPKINSPTHTRHPGSPVPTNPFGQPRGFSPPPTQPPHQPEPSSTNPFEQPRGFTPPPPQPTFQPPLPANIHIETAAAPPPANIHIEAPPAQPTPNIHYGAPAPAPVTYDVPGPYETSRAPNPFEPAPQPPVLASMPEPAPAPTPAPRSINRTAPPPISMPSPDQMPPPSYGAQAHSPYPRSPESLQESTARGAVRLSHLSMPPGPAPAYTPHDNAALPPRAVPITRDILSHPVSERDRIESRRQRYEREDALAHKAGGFWRGRGPFSAKGCFGRGGREGRLRRRWYAIICLFFLVIVIVAILLAIFLTRKGDNTPVQSAWLNLTGYPPMPTGISTIAGPENTVQDSGCITPSSMWSCALPKDQHEANEPYAANQPNFRVEIRFQNGSYEHSTVPITKRSMLDKRSAYQLFNPKPDPPSTDEMAFLGQYTDNTSTPYAGEETPFYITVLSAEYLSSSKSSSTNHTKRDKSNSTSSSNNSTSSFPDVTDLVPSPAKDSSGTAAAATLYPLPSSQPIRLFNRGKKDEHYGFYSYFDKSIFLASRTALTGVVASNKNDGNGGSTKNEANVRCTWAQTRFLVQIWTKGDALGRNLMARSANGTTNSTSTSTSESKAASSATDFTRPGSFPYPITITLDRHGGDAEKKNLYCYGLVDGARYNASAVKLQMENRAWNGAIVNRAPGIFNMGSANSTTDDDDGDKGKDKDYGGYDGGVGGCRCQWVNWVGAL